MQIIKNSINFNVIPNQIFNQNDLWFGGTIAFWEEFMSEREEDTKIMSRYLSKDYSYLDIGAWIGSTVLYGSQMAKKCYAFEPDPIAFKILENNILANPNITNIKSYSKAIADHTGKIQIGSNTNMGDSMSSILFNKNALCVDCVSLNTFFKDEDIQDCNFIKMDIEGGEFSVLPASKDFLQQIKPTLYLSLHTPWFSDKKLFLETIMDSISFYKNIYSSTGQLLKYNDILSLSGFTSIIATNKD